MEPTDDYLAGVEFLTTTRLAEIVRTLTIEGVERDALAPHEFHDLFTKQTTTALAAYRPRYQDSFPEWTQTALPARRYSTLFGRLNRFIYLTSFTTRNNDRLTFEDLTQLSQLPQLIHLYLEHCQIVVASPLERVQTITTPQFRLQHLVLINTTTPATDLNGDTVVKDWWAGLLSPETLVDFRLVGNQERPLLREMASCRPFSRLQRFDVTWSREQRGDIIHALAKCEALEELTLSDWTQGGFLSLSPGGGESQANLDSLIHDDLVPKLSSYRGRPEFALSFLRNRPIRRIDLTGRVGGLSGQPTPILRRILQACPQLEDLTTTVGHLENGFVAVLFGFRNLKSCHLTFRHPLTLAEEKEWLYAPLCRENPPPELQRLNIMYFAITMAAIRQHEIEALLEATERTLKSRCPFLHSVVVTVSAF